MRLLAIDASAGACSAAVCDGAVVLAADIQEVERGHARLLAPMIDRVMADAGLAFDQLDALAATDGPGSFTGIRIALATIRGIGLAAGLPVLTVDTLAALAAGASDPGPADRLLVAAMDSHRGDAFVQAFDARGAALGDAFVAAAGDAPGRLAPLRRAGGFRIAGDPAPALAAALAAAGWTGVESPGAPWPDARDVAVLAASRLAGAPGLAGSHGLVRARYLRAPSVRPPA
jgi:tRNA threonylcarbamoyladenosine biosynthesis protein TsaB